MVGILAGLGIFTPFALVSECKRKNETSLNLNVLVNVHENQLVESPVRIDLEQTQFNLNANSSKLITFYMNSSKFVGPYETELSLKVNSNEINKKIKNIKHG